jgi:hypothetical protein
MDDRERVSCCGNSDDDRDNLDAADYSRREPAPQQIRLTTHGEILDAPRTRSPALVLGDSSASNPALARPNAAVESCCMDAGSLRGVRFGASQDFSGDGGNFADTKEEEAEEIGNGVAFGPFQVEVRLPAGYVSDVQQ